MPSAEVSAPPRHGRYFHVWMSIFLAPAIVSFCYLLPVAEEVSIFAVAIAIMCFVLCLEMLLERSS